MDNIDGKQKKITNLKINGLYYLHIPWISNESYDTF